MSTESCANLFLYIVKHRIGRLPSFSSKLPAPYIEHSGWWTESRQWSRLVARRRASRNSPLCSICHVLSAIDHSRPYARSTADRPCVPALIRPHKYRTNYNNATRWQYRACVKAALCIQFISSNINLQLLVTEAICCCKSGTWGGKRCPV